MANDEKLLSKLNIGGELYNIKDAEARTRLTQAEADIDALETGKQDKIDATHMLAASLVSFTKDEDSKLTSTEVNSALLELEAAIESGGTGSVVTVEKAATATTGYAATYVVKQGGSQVGVAIDIPKDYLVKSAELKTAGKSDPSGFPEGTKYIDFVVNAKDGAGTESHIYLNVADLVDAYTADEATIQMVNNQFSVKAVPMNLVTGLNDALALKADDADLQAEVARAEAAEAEKLAIADAGALAYKDSATGTVPSQNITGVKATGDLSGSVSMTISSTATAADLTKGDFTPAGTITGSAISDGSVEVTLADAAVATEAALTRDDYTPAGTVTAPSITVTPSDDTIQPVTNVGAPTTIDTSKFNGGAAASWTGKSWTPAALGDQTQGDFVTEAIVVDKYENETLSFKAATTAKAVTDRGSFTPDTLAWGTFDGGSAASLNEGFYTVGSAPTLGTAKTFMTGATAALDANPVFEGTKETGLKVTKAEYKKQVVSDAEFTGTAATLGFSGTKAENVLVTGVNYDKANASQTGSATIEDASLDVGTITVAAKDVTVS